MSLFCLFSLQAVRSLSVCVSICQETISIYSKKKKKHLQIILNKDKLRDYSKSPDI